MLASIKKVKVGIYNDDDTIKISRVADIDGMSEKEKEKAIWMAAMHLYKAFYDSEDCTYEMSYRDMRFMGECLYDSISKFSDGLEALPLADRDKDDQTYDIFITLKDKQENDRNIGFKLTPS